MFNQLSPKQKKLAAGGLGAAIVLFLFLRSRTGSAAQVTTTSAPDALTAAPAGVPADFGTDPSGAGGASSGYDPSSALSAIGDQISGLAGTVADNSAAVTTLSDTVAANANQIATAGTPESFGQQLTDVVGAVKAVNAITQPKAPAKKKPAVTHKPAHTPARSPSQHPAAVHHAAPKRAPAKKKPAKKH